MKVNNITLHLEVHKSDMRGASKTVQTGPEGKTKWGKEETENRMTKVIKLTWGGTVADNENHVVETHKLYTSMRTEINNMFRNGKKEEKENGTTS